MDTQQSKNFNTGNVNTNGGNFVLGDTNFYKSAEYQDFQKSISRLQRLIELTDGMSEKLKFSRELNELENELKAFKRDIIQLAETFQKIDIDTERLRLAKQHFDNGEYKAARAVLDAEQMTGELDALLAEKEKLSEKTTQNTAYLKDKANEFLILAVLTAADYDLGKKRYGTAKRYFENSLKADRNAPNLFHFAVFLQNHQQILHATPLYKEALIVVSRKLNDENSEIYLSFIAPVLNK